MCPGGGYSLESRSILNIGNDDVNRCESIMLYYTMIQRCHSLHQPSLKGICYVSFISTWPTIPAHWYDNCVNLMRFEYPWCALLVTRCHRNIKAGPYRFIVLGILLFSMARYSWYFYEGLDTKSFIFEIELPLRCFCSLQICIIFSRVSR